MGRKPQQVTKTFVDGSGKSKEVTVKLFPWEEEDLVAKFKTAFSI
jgi:hypothetical protein